MFISSLQALSLLADLGFFLEGGDIGNPSYRSERAMSLQVQWRRQDFGSRRRTKPHQIT